MTGWVLIRTRCEKIIGKTLDHIAWKHVAMSNNSNNNSGCDSYDPNNINIKQTKSKGKGGGEGEARARNDMEWP